jgi:hypothetical protein
MVSSLRKENQAANTKARTTLNVTITIYYVKLSSFPLGCAGYLGYPFSNVTLSCDEPHERDAGLFPARHHNHLQRFREVPSSQAPVATPSAILKRGYHMLGFLILFTVAV